MQDNLFEWVKLDKPVKWVVHYWEVILKFRSTLWDKNQGCTPLRSLVCLKFCFKAFWVHREVL